MKDINEIYKELTERNAVLNRPLEIFSWGTTEECKTIFEKAFRLCEKDSPFEWLPEYDEIVEWMTDTKGKGLFLTGSCGRGKTVVICGVIPILMGMQNKMAKPFHADTLEQPYKGKLEAISNPTNFDYLCFARYPVIDEMGVEPMMNVFGEKFEAVSRIISIAESKGKPLFISTNMNGNEVVKRYSQRTLDRIMHLCKIVKFNGKSMRK